MSYALKLGGAAIIVLLLGVLGILLFDAVWARVGLGAALVVVFGGILLFAWNVDRKDKAKRAGLDELPRRLSPASARLRLRLGLALMLGGCASTSDEITPENAFVARIGDGDTLDVRGGARVRLVQIDAPELGEGECYAQEAKRELERLAPPRHARRAESDPELDDVDRYGRLLRYVNARGRT